MNLFYYFKRMFFLEKYKLILFKIIINYIYYFVKL